MHTPLIGILGGMGPLSTGMFLDLVAATCVRRYGAHHDIDFPRMLICSQPAPFYPDRAVDHEALAAATLDGLRRLDQRTKTENCRSALWHSPTMGCALASLRSRRRPSRSSLT